MNGLKTIWYKNAFKRIKTLLENISTNPESGIGKLEKLKQIFRIFLKNNKL